MSVEDDLRTLFGGAREAEPTDAELAAALAQVRARRGGARVAWWSLVLALAGAVLAAAVTSAATGLGPLGQVIGGGFDGTPVRERVVAGGELPVAGPWRITTFASGGGEADCLKLALVGESPPPGPLSAGVCGGSVGFSELALGRRGAAAARGAAILFGTAPAAARTVELRGGAGVVGRVPAQGAGPQRFWALSGPADLAGAELAWRDAGGRVGGVLDVGHRFGQPEGRRQVLRGAAPGGRRWTLTAYEGRRHRVGNDLYEPEGLPCLRVAIDPPPARLSSAGGFCGIQPATPGFTRGQWPIGGPRRLVLLYGHAPPASRRVVLEGPAGVRSIAVHRARDGGPGHYWAVVLPYAGVRGATVRWVAPDGRYGRRVALLPW